MVTKKYVRLYFYVLSDLYLNICSLLFTLLNQDQCYIFEVPLKGRQRRPTGTAVTCDPGRLRSNRAEPEFKMQHGFTAPYTPAGRSSLIPPPPWHYAAWIFTVEYELDSTLAQTFLPAELGVSTGLATANFVEWQVTSDGSELRDPVYSQYKEFFVHIQAQRPDRSLANFCPFIYVDQDMSMMRGWLQGLPKKLGSVWMTRSFAVDHIASAPLKRGTKLGGSLAVKDRRLAEVELKLTGAEGDRLGFFSAPTFGLVGFANLVDTPRSADLKLVRHTADDVVHGPFHAAEADLRYFESPRDELHDLRPIRTRRAATHTFAWSVSKVEHDPL